MIIKRPGGLGSWPTGRDYPINRITEQGQNTEESPGDLRRLAVTQSQVKNNTDVKNSKRVNDNNNDNNNIHYIPEMSMHGALHPSNDID